jgi:hypothetical protein
MEIGQRKEQISIAYVRAVAATAGYTVYEPEVDDDSIDLGLAARSRNGTRRSPRLELQLKCTSRATFQANTLQFSLKKKNYDDLRGSDFLVPRILVVMFVPDLLDNWLVQSEDMLLLRHCSYWHSLRTYGERPNASAVQIAIDRRQLFTVAALRELMQMVERGEAP